MKRIGGGESWRMCIYWMHLHCSGESGGARFIAYTAITATAAKGEGAANIRGRARHSIPRENAIPLEGRVGLSFGIV